MNGKTIMACIDAAHGSLTAHTDEIALLDQQIGDGDHIFNMLRGMEALLAVRAQIEAEAFGPALELAGSKVLSTVGGSSGPLFFSLLNGMAKAAMFMSNMPITAAPRSPSSVMMRCWSGLALTPAALASSARSRRSESRRRLCARRAAAICP